MASEIFFTTTRGRLKGHRLRVHQMCNDWVTAHDLTADEYANGGQPINLRSCIFADHTDRVGVLLLNDAGHLGQMFRLYYDLEEFMLSGKFKRLA